MQTIPHWEKHKILKKLDTFWKLSCIFDQYLKEQKSWSQDIVTLHDMTIFLHGCLDFHIWIWTLNTGHSPFNTMATEKITLNFGVFFSDFLATFRWFLYLDIDPEPWTKPPHLTKQYSDFYIFFADFFYHFSWFYGCFSV